MFLEQLSYTRDIDDKETALATIIGEKLTSREIEQYLKQKAKEAVQINLNPTKRKGPRL